MKACAACGHPLGLGRFCNNCGHPVDAVDPVVPVAAEPAEPPAPNEPSAPTEAPEDWRTTTAERTVVRSEPPAPAPAPTPPASGPPPKVPPSAITRPPPPRYRLYADEVPVGSPEPDHPADPADPAPIVETAPTIEEPEPHEEWEPDEDERRSVLTWVAAILLLAMVAVGGWLAWEYLRDDSGGAPGDPQATDGSSTGDGQPDPVDVASRATAVAPETAPPSEDVDGELVSFDASNMLDGVTETAWRAPGDATGMELTFRLAERTTLTSVGMINGYAKRAKDPDGRSYDWYRGNRRVTGVVWEFGDDTTVRQKLGDDRSVQSVDIDPVTTKKVIVRLVQVSAPGEGRAGQDFTAISEVSLVELPS